MLNLMGVQEMQFYFIYFIFYFYPHRGHFFYCFLEREEGRERNTSVREKDRLLPPVLAWTGDHRHPDWGLNLQPRYVP